MWYVEFARQTVRDAKKLKAAGLDKKAKSLVELVMADPFANPPAYGALVGNLSGYYSRRISIQHRFVYQVSQEAAEVGGETYEGIVKVVRMLTHYEGL